MSRIIFSCILIAVLICASSARAAPQTFDEGSLIIPMDIDYQDDGMFKAFGLLYQLLLADVKVHWIISPDKAHGGVDFETSATDHETGDEIKNHGYRGGPFVIEADEADDALAVVDEWQAEHVTAVHIATEEFTGDVNRTLTVAPIIGIFADGNEDIAFDYLNAAAIPDSLGQEWPHDKDKTLEYEGYPDVLSISEVHGPTDTDHTDGILFDDAGLPVYCELMTMHWDVKKRDEEAIAEVREFLYFPTHFFAECQAVNAVENAENGRFLTPNGYIMDKQPDDVEVVNPNLPFSQFDGLFQTVGGSEPSYTLPDGDEYFDEGVVMITEDISPIGTRDVWMTGYIDGICDVVPVEKKGPGTEECDEGVGKVSYLGGHKYSVKTPLSDNPDAQGTRLFLNALFEADCVTTLGQPNMSLSIDGPSWTAAPEVDLSLTIDNSGAGVSYDNVMSVTLPDGMTLDSSDVEPTDVSGSTLTWEAGNIGPGNEFKVDISVVLDAKDTYKVTGDLTYRVGQNTIEEPATTFTVVYSDEPPPDGGAGDADIDSDSDNDMDSDSDGGLLSDSGLGDGGETGQKGSSSCGCSTIGAGKPGHPLSTLSAKIVLFFLK